MATQKKQSIPAEGEYDGTTQRKRQTRGKPIRGRNPKVRNLEFQKDKGFIDYINDNVEVRDSMIPGAGKGAFWVGEEPLQPNKTIGVFDGEYLTEMEFFAKYGDSLADKVFRTRDGTFIDGSQSKHWSVFVNDGRADGVNNLRTNKDGRIITKNKITKNQEILMSYGSFPWDMVFKDE